MNKSAFKTSETIKNIYILANGNGIDPITLKNNSKILALRDLKNQQLHVNAVRKGGFKKKRGSNIS